MTTYTDREQDPGSPSAPPSYWWEDQLYHLARSLGADIEPPAPEAPPTKPRPDLAIPPAPANVPAAPCPF